VASHDWPAVCDHMLPTPTLTVTGSVLLDSPGYTDVGLHRIEPGDNLDDLLLDVHATPPRDPVSSVMTPYEVSYEESPPEREYDSVSIVSTGPSGVKVDHRFRE
jgi:hypothetical protein